MAIDKQTLEDLYINKQLSMKNISDLIGVVESGVLRLMRKYGIPSRPAVKKKALRPTKEEFENLHLVEKKTITEISKLYKVNRNLVADWAKEYDVPINYFKQHLKPSKEVLLKLYNEDELNVKALMANFDVSRRVIRGWFKDYGIKIDSPQNQNEHLRALSLSQIQKEFIVGTLLGDGYMTGTGVLQNTHGPKQLNYLKWKQELMAPFAGPISKRDSKFGTGNRWNSITHPEIALFHPMFYNGKKKVIKPDIFKYLTPFALAIWVMDDGWRCGHQISISSESFTAEEHIILQEVIKERFSLDVKIRSYHRHDKDYNHLYFDWENSVKLTDLIKPHVIDLLKYKLIPINARDVKKKFFIDKGELEKLYFVEKQTIYQIAEKYEVSQGVIARRLKNYKIQINQT